MRKWARGIVALVGLLSVAGLLVAWTRPTPEPVELGEASFGPMRVTVDATGMARARERTVISAPVGGHLERIAIQPGARVAAGDVLAVVVAASPAILDSRTREELRARVAVAEAAEAEAKAAVERAKVAHRWGTAQRARVEALRAKEAIAEQEVESARFEAEAREKDLRLAEMGKRTASQQVRAVRASLAGAKEHAAGEAEGRVAVRAPRAGRVLQVLRESEGPVAVGTPLLEVGDTERLEVVAELLSTQAVRVRRGALVEVDRWGGSGLLHGKVTRVDPVARTKVSALGVEEQRVDVVVEPDSQEAGWRALGDGYQVEVRIAVWQTEGVLRVPAGALVRTANGWAVYVVQSGRASLRNVRVGERSDAFVEVLEGVDAGEQVVLYAGDRVKEGTAVVGAG